MFATFSADETLRRWRSTVTGPPRETLFRTCIQPRLKKLSHDTATFPLCSWPAQCRPLRRFATASVSPARTTLLARAVSLFMAGDEIVLNSSQAYANPYGEVDVTATFTGPGGTASRVRRSGTAAMCGRCDSRPRDGCWRADECSDRANDGPAREDGAWSACRVSERQSVLSARVSARQRKPPPLRPRRRHAVLLAWRHALADAGPRAGRRLQSSGPCEAGVPARRPVPAPARRPVARGFNVYQTYPSPTSAAWWREPYTAHRPGAISRRVRRPDGPSRRRRAS